MPPWNGPYKMYLLGPKLLSMEMPIPNFCSWNRHGDSMSRSSEFWIPIEFRILNFCPWNRNGNYMNRSSEFGIPLPFLTYLPKKSQNGMWNSEFRTSAHGIAMAIPRAEVRNSEFYWNSEFRTSALGIPMAIPWAEVRNRHLHGQKFRP